jgi:hypothetical protein
MEGVDNMFKIFKGYFAAGFGTILGMSAGMCIFGAITNALKGKQAEEETDPDIETEE